MTLDFHFHVDSSVTAAAARAPRGCAISPSSAANAGYLRFSRRSGVPCALFTDPRDERLDELVSLVASGAALSYQHLESIDDAGFERLAPMLQACEAADLPVVVHVSRHRGPKYSQDEAKQRLTRILDRHPRIRLVVSHCGGENLAVALAIAAGSRHVFLDTSCLANTAERCGADEEALLREIARSLPAAQLVYGSDAAWPHPAAGAPDIAKLRRTFTTGAIEQICRSSGEALLRAWRGPPTQATRQ